MQFAYNYSLLFRYGSDFKFCQVPAESNEFGAILVRDDFRKIIFIRTNPQAA